MSDIKQYIDEALASEYTFLQELSKTSIHTLKLYENKSTHRRLVLIESKHRNDEVFRALRGVRTHGYTPQVYEVASEEKALYVVEEYVEGEPLADYLMQDKLLPKERVIDVLIDLCNALTILHSLQIVHRDIKPENIVLTAQKACLIDFSAAKMITNKSTDTVNLGTAGFAAPEQYGVSQSLPTADIYALGVLANILLLGVHPTSDMPGGYLGKIIQKCTQTQTSKRYQSAEQLKKALLRAKKFVK